MHAQCKHIALLSSEQIDRLDDTVVTEELFGLADAPQWRDPHDEEASPLFNCSHVLFVWPFLFIWVLIYQHTVQPRSEVSTAPSHVRPAPPLGRMHLKVTKGCKMGSQGGSVTVLVALPTRLPLSPPCQSVSASPSVHFSPCRPFGRFSHPSRQDNAQRHRKGNETLKLLAIPALPRSASFILIRMMATGSRQNCSDPKSMTFQRRSRSKDAKRSSASELIHCALAVTKSSTSCCADTSRRSSIHSICACKCAPCRPRTHDACLNLELNTTKRRVSLELG